ncbi:23S rRNA (adenine(2503)-C(2))-methyltransferase RlmN [Candidatus Odyssella acanthamoebae]|uniref:Dual-specificity RNA methyltransferase RlmN n=1 Tax=Candidatus Odyssella acanthamoebae TaxID=91604 RepID=A0A077AYJ8_9PROT|nr:23S rRNA (adenine(2503)-C(2))-methyltransferase RlmN [Candidatus Paracaedibacter acanthamoebae]AIK95795.1 50S rRNA methyltransferase [Candidatus Paracaedibacter acanthamoebae]
MTQKQNIIGIAREDLEKEFIDAGIPKFRTKQIWHWLYFQGVRSFEDMPNIPKDLRQKLGDSYTIHRPEVSKALISVDGTQKWLLKFVDGEEAECVHIPEVDRGTICLSSQVGCTLTCKFCHTGTQKLVRNLTAAEIVGQMMVARDAFNEWPTPSSNRHVSNIVMMGMGEPLYNFDNVAKALKIIMDPEGISLSKRKITLSTSGVVPMMDRCGEEIGVNLAVSLHAVRDDLRNTLVPLNKKYPLKDLIDACRRYPGVNNANRITFEYVMLKGINDTNVDAKELVRLIRGIPAKINLIPFNPWPSSDYECSTPERIAAFSDIVFKAGYSSPVRTPRGRDILAACGQLKSESVRQSKSLLSSLNAGI